MNSKKKTSKTIKFPPEHFPTMKKYSIFDRPFNHKIMSPRKPEDFEKIRSTKREHILKSALELFASYGLSVSISKISKHAEISKGLLYHYFDSKDELIKAILLEGFDQISSAFDTNSKGVLSSEEFDSLIDETFQLIVENREYWKLYFAVMFQPQALPYIQNYAEEILPSIMKIMADFFSRKNSPDPESDAMFFGTAMDGIAMNAVMNPDLFPLDKIKSSIKRIIQNM